MSRCTVARDEAGGAAGDGMKEWADFIRTLGVGRR